MEVHFDMVENNFEKEPILRKRWIFILKRLILILRAILGRCHSGILFENITEIVRVVISRFPRYLRTFDIGGAKHFLSLIKSEENKILCEGLSVLLGKDCGESAVTHIYRLCNVLKHKVGIGEMLGHIKLCFAYDAVGICVTGYIPDLSGSEDHRLSLGAVGQNMSYMTCGFKTL